MTTTTGQALTIESMTLIGEDGTIFKQSLGTFAFNAGIFHSFTSKQESFWQGSTIPSGFSTTGKTAYDFFLGYLEGYSLDEMYSDDFGLPANFEPVVVRHAGLADSDDVVVDELSFYFGAIDNSAGSGYPSLFKCTMSEFGTAKSTYDSLIKAALAA